MVDSTGTTVTDSNYTSLVKSSYDDVNNALEDLLGNVTGNSGNYATVAALTALQNQVNNITESNPVGSVIAFTTNTIPNGYLLCNGAPFDTSKYSQLYSALGTSSVPDMRGLFLRGLDTSGSIDNYGSTRALLSFEEGTRTMIDYNNAITSFYYNQGQFTNVYLGQDAVSDPTQVYNYAYTTQNLQYNGVTSVKNSNGFFPVGATRPKNIAVNYIIKAVP